MGLSGILFNPQGRISPSEFWRGAIILIGASIVFGVVSAYSSIAVSSILTLASFLMIYPMICVYGKRFHDNGRTAWLVIVVFLVGGVIYLVSSSVLLPIMAPEVAAFQEELAEQAANGEIGFADIMERSREMSTDGPVLMLGIVVTLITSLLPAFFVARLESDPDENEHGMPTSGAAADTFS